MHISGNSLESCVPILLGICMSLHFVIKGRQSAKTVGSVLIMFKGFNPKACVDKIGLGYAACFREKSSVLKKDSRCFFRPPKIKKHEVLYCLDNVSKCIRSQSMFST